MVCAEGAGGGELDHLRTHVQVTWGNGSHVPVSHIVVMLGALVILPEEAYGMLVNFTAEDMLVLDA